MVRIWKNLKMKRSTKITSIIIIFFLIIASAIIARTMIGNHFQKKFSKRPPPGIIVTEVKEKAFTNKVNTFGTAVPIRIKSYKVEKYEILEPIKFNHKVKKGDLIAKLKYKNILAPFDGTVGKRDFSDDLEVSKTSILLNIEDSSTIYIDVNIPEIFAPQIKVGLPVDIKFSGYDKKNYSGIIQSIASRISKDTRSLAARIQMDNSSSEILPGSLLEISIKYNAREALSIPDTSTIIEGDKVYVYKIDNKNIAKRLEIKIGTRDKGNIEVISGLKKGDIVAAEGLKKVRPNGKIKPIKK